MLPLSSFAGFQLSEDGYSDVTAITDTLTHFSTPVSCTDLCPFLVSQRTCLKYWPYCKSTGTIATVVQHQEQVPVDPVKPSSLSPDASRHGLGFIHQQCHHDKWTLVQMGSHCENINSWKRNGRRIITQLSHPTTVILMLHLVQSPGVSHKRIKSLASN